MRRNKICLISAGILPIPDVKGGAIEHLITMLVEDNERFNFMDLTVVSVFDEKAEHLQKDYKNSKFVYLRPSSKDYGLLYKLKKKIRWHLRDKFNYDIHFRNTYVYLVDKFLKKEGFKFNLIVSEGYDYEALVTASKLFGKNKVCWHLHMNPPFNRRIDKIYGKCVAVSEYIINKYRGMSTNDKANTAVIFNGIDINLYNQPLKVEEKNSIRSSLGIKDDDFVIVFCGRIVKIKGIEELINAVVSINNPKIKLLIIGSSNFGDGDRGYFPQMIKELVKKHSDIIRFTGYVDNKSVYKYHKVSDIGVIPSTYHDPCPLSMFEMIASGLPTIATAAGGMVEIGNKDCTIFINIDNITKELMESIKLLYNSPKLRNNMSEAALKRSLDFTREIYYTNFCKTLNKLINE